MITTAKDIGPGQDMLPLHMLAVYQSSVRAVVDKDITPRRRHYFSVPSRNVF